MNFDKLYLVLNKCGFFNTLHVLSLYKDYRVEKGEFYKKLTEFSNYNSFLRIKDKLLEKELILVDRHNEEEHIELTKKGRSVYDNQEINSIYLKKKVIKICRPR